MSEERLKIAIFIDFDNIEIGVKKTLSRRFDIEAVLEAIKERGEVVTKVAYGNWKQAEGYSRDMTDHAIQMVQRNTTPGGDKNGADINLALDALEMAFTRDHINTFVIVGGDSDFIALVEKLKQYDKRVFIVGGRAFTSAILQRNCHEFIAYENLLRKEAPARKPAAASGTATASSKLANAVPLVRRALKVLADREVSPQLGLLKSTLLQLDSTFSERDHDASSFREFIEKLADAGYVTLKQVDRSLIVEPKNGKPETPSASPTPGATQEPAPAAERHPVDPELAAEAMMTVEELFKTAKREARWPMYVRNVKQFLKSVQPDFDERRFGLSGILDLVKEGQKAGLFRIERNRQGALQVHPGARLVAPPKEEAPEPEARPLEDAVPVPAEHAAESVPVGVPPIPAEIVPEVQLLPFPDGIPAPKPKRTRAAKPRTAAKPKAKSRGRTKSSA